MQSFTFDQYQSAGIIERLKVHARSRGLHTYIGDFTPSRSKAYEIAETTKVALYERRIHSPDYPELIDELLYLQDLGDRVDHPSTGPVTTNDWVTCLFAVVAFIQESTRDPRAMFGTSLRARPWPVSAYDQQVYDALGSRSLGLGSAGGQRRESYRDQRTRRRKR